MDLLEIENTLMGRCVCKMFHFEKHCGREMFLDILQIVSGDDIDKIFSNCVDND